MKGSMNLMNKLHEDHTFFLFIKAIFVNQIHIVQMFIDQQRRKKTEQLPTKMVESLDFLVWRA